MGFFAVNAVTLSAQEIFGPGVLSVGEVYRGSFTPGGHDFYFFKKTGKGEDYRIFVSHLVGSRWSEPDSVMLGGQFSDLYPSVSPSADRLFFSSYRPYPNDTSHTARIWYVERSRNGWSNPIPFPGNMPGYYHSWVEVGPDGSVYFRRTTPDWRSTETMVARLDGHGGYVAPAPYEPALRARRLRPSLRIAWASPGPDGTVLLDVATQDSATGKRGSDIWVMSPASDQLQRLGPAINGPGYDVFPFFSPSGADLFFVRDFRSFYRMG